MDADSPVSREEFVNPFGRALCIRRRFPQGPLGRLAERGTPLERRLDLVHGVGSYTRAKLEGLGYASLADLARHPRFGKSANAYLDGAGEAGRAHPSRGGRSRCRADASFSQRGDGRRRY